ncbi:anthranilate phosphoribosyltransferase [Methylotenera sp.]|uniref:anthranilate phosphoribosyltransferase n=1 Tax=Methylotenera sp. TaxID=2051956 RepID=UPI002489B3BB|nr:anthranilate phosphoribosyltransferase [Methylotenera sp.]MDI1360795.1 anthranilate phosphoribosyltransferase [Methylotenera sp.]
MAEGQVILERETMKLSFKEALQKLLDRENFTHAQMLEIMRMMMSGELTSVQISSLLMGLRMKGETVDEIAAAAKVMRDLSTKVTINDTSHLIDTCGTGGDGIQTFNVSTVCAFVASAAGAKVAKHGGRSVSSTCGSADVLEALGVNVNLSPEQVAKCVDSIGIGFMFAPNHHSAMKHAAPVRREMGIRTLFNLLGPMTNPAGAKRQVMGVFHKDLTILLAQVLQRLGSTHVMVVHGADGMDEISFTGDTYVAELKNGAVTEYTLNPSQFGMQNHDLKTIQVQNAEESKAMILDVLSGKKGAARDIVILNAGAAIYVSGVADSLQSGINLAAQVIDNGTAMAKLQALKQESAA